MSADGPSELVSTAEFAAVERLLSRKSMLGSGIQDVKLVWGERRHLLRVTSSSDTVILKRAKTWQDGTIDTSAFRSEVAALNLCDGMPEAVAPRTIGYDKAADLLLMEDLPAGLALSDLLLLGGPVDAAEGVNSVARALGAVHAWTSTREANLKENLSRFVIGERAWQPWNERAVLERSGFVSKIEALGVATAGVDTEIDCALDTLTFESHRGLIHGDLCPDNVRVSDQGARIFDFEASIFGPWALDVAYFLAPFPSCWCFAELPQSVAMAALASYEAEVSRFGIELGDKWQEELAAALVCYLVVRIGAGPGVQDADDEWGTTSMRTRIVTWLRCFLRFAPCEEVFPTLGRVVRDTLEVLSRQWRDIERPAYPAFADSSSATVEIPQFWQPGL